MDAYADGWGVVPHEITYEELAGDPIGVTHDVLDHLGLVLPPDTTVVVRDRQQADALNADWVARFRDRAR